MRKIALMLAAALLSPALSAAPAQSSPASVLPAWRTTGTSWTNPAAHRPRVVDLRYAKHFSFDRVVIELTGKIPGGKTAYRRHFHYDASGDLVPIRGGLEVVLKPAFTTDDSGTDVYTGPRLARPDFPTLKAIALTGSFEGVVSFGFGLSPRRAAYRVFMLHHPQRLVIDFKHS